MFANRAFSPLWPASMQIYWNRKKKSSAPTGLVWDTNMAAVSLTWDLDIWYSGVKTVI